MFVDFVRRPLPARSAIAIAIAVAMVAGAVPVAAQTVASSTDVPRTYWLIVSGLSGEAEYAANYALWSGKIAAAAKERFGAQQVWRLAEKEGAGIDGVSSKANIDAKLRDVAAAATPSDALFVILIGHGSFSDNVGRIGLPGPDLVAADLAVMLSPVQARTTVINAASTSGSWIAPLAAKGRVVVTATKSGVEQNETTFAGYFADALSTDAADTDKDNRVSVLEAYEYSRREVERAYAADKRMLTEHAQIDGNGDGKGVATAATDSPDGAIAGLTHFGLIGARTTATGATIPQTPELRALYAEKTKLERRLADLRARKADIPEAEYQKQLEAVLLEIAVNGQSIRKLEGGK